MKTLSLALSLAVLAIAAQPALAHEHSGHGTAAPAIDLPAVCLADLPTATHEVPTMQMEGDEAHVALMAGMDRMNSEMMAGGMAADIDVAFICSMIPHHRGAIDMARAVIKYGDDDWSKALAEQIIAAQEQEIADMLAWLEAQ